MQRTFREIEEALDLLDARFDQLSSPTPDQREWFALAKRELEDELDELVQQNEAAYWERQNQHS